MKISLYSLSARDMTPEEVVVAAVAQGVEGIEWWCREGGHCDTADLIANARRLAALCRENGLEIVGLASYLAPLSPPEVEPFLEAAAAMGAPLLRCHTPVVSDEESYRAKFAAWKDWVEQVLPLCARYGRRLAVEQHHNQIFPSIASAMRLIEGLPVESIGIIYDPGNALNEGWERPRTAIDMMGGYLAHVHVKNGVCRPPEEGRAALPGLRHFISYGALKDGVIDWAGVISELRRAGYAGWLSLESLDARPSAEKLQQDIPYLKSIV